MLQSRLFTIDVYSRSRNRIKQIVSAFGQIGLDKREQERQSEEGKKLRMCTQIIIIRSILLFTHMIWAT